MARKGNREAQKRLQKKRERKQSKRRERRVSTGAGPYAVGRLEPARGAPPVDAVEAAPGEAPPVDAVEAAPGPGEAPPVEEAVPAPPDPADEPISEEAVPPAEVAPQAEAALEPAEEALPSAASAPQALEEALLAEEAPPLDEPALEEAPAEEPEVLEEDRPAEAPAADTRQRAAALVEEAWRLSGDPARARGLLEQALELEPRFVPGAVLLAELDSVQGRPQGARARAQAALERDGSLDPSTRRHLQKRLAALQRGQVLGALAMDPGHLAQAMHRASYGKRTWVDPATASLVDRGPWPGAEKGEDRFPVPPLDANEARGLRSLFVNRLEPGHLQDLLMEAAAEGARFDEVLAGDPEAEAQWRAYLVTMLGDRPRLVLYEEGYR